MLPSKKSNNYYIVSLVSFVFSYVPKRPSFRTLRQTSLFSISSPCASFSRRLTLCIAGIYPRDSRDQSTWLSVAIKLRNFALSRGNFSVRAAPASLSSGCNSRTSTEYQCRRRRSLSSFASFSILLVSGHKSLEGSSVRIAKKEERREERRDRERCKRRGRGEME